MLIDAQLICLWYRIIHEMKFHLSVDWMVTECWLNGSRIRFIIYIAIRGEIMNITETRLNGDWKDTEWRYSVLTEWWHFVLWSLCVPSQRRVRLYLNHSQKAWITSLFKKKKISHCRRYTNFESNAQSKVFK